MSMYHQVREMNRQPEVVGGGATKGGQCCQRGALVGVGAREGEEDGGEGDGELDGGRGEVHGVATAQVDPVGAEEPADEAGEGGEGGGVGEAPEEDGGPLGPPHDGAEALLGVHEGRGAVAGHGVGEEDALPAVAEVGGPAGGNGGGGEGAVVEEEVGEGLLGGPHGGRREDHGQQKCEDAEHSCHVMLRKCSPMDL